jgi:hypothetical protein
MLQKPGLICLCPLAIIFVRIFIQVGRRPEAATVGSEAQQRLDLSLPDIISIMSTVRIQLRASPIQAWPVERKSEESRGVVSSDSRYQSSTLQELVCVGLPKQPLHIDKVALHQGSGDALRLALFEEIGCIDNQSMVTKEGVGRQRWNGRNANTIRKAFRKAADK